MKSFKIGMVSLGVGMCVVLFTGCSQQTHYGEFSYLETSEKIAELKQKAANGDAEAQDRLEQLREMELECRLEGLRNSSGLTCF